MLWAVAAPWVVPWVSSSVATESSVSLGCDGMSTAGRGDVGEAGGGVVALGACHSPATCGGVVWQPVICGTHQGCWIGIVHQSIQDSTGNTPPHRYQAMPLPMSTLGTYHFQMIVYTFHVSPSPCPRSCLACSSARRSSLGEAAATAARCPPTAGSSMTPGLCRVSDMQCVARQWRRHWIMQCVLGAVGCRDYVGC
jgi:hypothetical protein